jgi:predicted branched-subunit amino acid permease
MNTKHERAPWTSHTERGRQVDASTAPSGVAPKIDARRLALGDVLPLAVSVFQFGVAIGATIASSNVDPIAALAGAATLSAGASQLAGLELIDAGVGIGVAITTALLINVRFVLYGAGFARWFAAAPRWQRYAMVYPIVDQSFLLCERRFVDHDDLRWRTRYYLTVCAGLFVSFLSGQVAGFFLGDLIPPAAALHLAGPIAFAGLLATATSNRGAVIAASAAGAAMMLTASTPGGIGLPIAATIGIVAGAACGTHGEEQMS